MSVGQTAADVARSAIAAAQRAACKELLDWAQETGRISAASRPAWASDFDSNPKGALAVLKRLAPCAPGPAEPPDVIIWSVEKVRPEA